MLLSSVIIVLREVLEAALLFSLLMVLSVRLTISCRWIFIALPIGLLGAAIYGFNIERVSGWFDGVGQEIVNAFLQYSIYALLCVITALSMRRYRGLTGKKSMVSVSMIACITLAIVREGSEIMIYLSGFTVDADLLLPVLAGGIIGAAIGISTGAVFYFVLLSLTGRAAMITGVALLGLVAAGMSSQATLLLIQADWLPAQFPVWDSSWLVSEQSVTGQILYALIGYEATPTPVQLTVYAAAIAVLFAIAVFAGSRSRNDGVGNA